MSVSDGQLDMPKNYPQLQADQRRRRKKVNCGVFRPSLMSEDVRESKKRNPSGNVSLHLFILFLIAVASLLNRMVSCHYHIDPALTQNARMDLWSAHNRANTEEKKKEKKKKRLKE